MKLFLNEKKTNFLIQLHSATHAQGSFYLVNLTDPCIVKTPTQPNITFVGLDMEDNLNKAEGSIARALKCF